MKKWISKFLFVVFGFGLAHAAPALPIAEGLSTVSNITISIEISEKQLNYFTDLHSYPEEIQGDFGMIPNPETRLQFTQEFFYKMVQRDAKRKRTMEKKKQDAQAVKNEKWDDDD